MRENRRKIRLLVAKKAEVARSVLRGGLHPGIIGHEPSRDDERARLLG